MMKEMKKILLMCIMAVMTLGVVAQNRQKPFDPERFQNDLERFITQKAGLTQAQATRFFPLYREMQRKQRTLFNEMRQLRNVNANDDDACERAIRRMDNIDLQIRKIQKDYHQKFFSVMPAGKVMEVLRAEDQFHRQAFKRAAGHERGRK